MKFKFKIGDKVRVRAYFKYARIGEVVEVFEHSRLSFRVRLRHNDEGIEKEQLWWYGKDELELIDADVIDNQPLPLPG